MMVSRMAFVGKPLHGAKVTAKALSVGTVLWLAAHRNHFPIAVSLSASPCHSVCGGPVLSNTVGRNAGARGMMMGAVMRVV